MLVRDSAGCGEDVQPGDRLQRSALPDRDESTETGAHPQRAQHHRVVDLAGAQRGQGNRAALEGRRCAGSAQRRLAAHRGALAAEHPVVEQTVDRLPGGSQGVSDAGKIEQRGQRVGRPGRRAREWWRHAVRLATGAGVATVGGRRGTTAPAGISPGAAEAADQVVRLPYAAILRTAGRAGTTDSRRHG